MDKLKRFIARILPFSPKGWAFLAAAAALATLGLLRSELAVLFWGAAFGLSAVLSAAGTLVTHAVVSRRTRGGSTGTAVALEPPRVRESSDARLRLQVPLPHRRIPGIRLYVVARLEWNGRRLSQTAFVSPGAQELAVPIDTSRRGAYALNYVGIVARDLLGFCERSLSLPCAGTLRILPTAEERALGEVTGGAGGEVSVRSSLRHRSEELFETRRYVPGDDPRKINWNLFARWNELLVRVGEEVPPPRSSVLCYLYTGGPGARGAPGAPKVRSGRGTAAAQHAATDQDEQLLEATVSVFAGVCRILTARGVAVSYGFGGTEIRGSLAQMGEPDFLADLAEADWDGGRLPAPGDANNGNARVPVVAVIPAGTKGIEEIRARLRHGNRRVETLEVPRRRDSDGAAQPPAWWRRLLFTPLSAQGGRG